LNVHPSLLPKYRGPTPFQTALLNGDTETGTTIMFMDEQLDHGPIIAQEKVKIEAGDTSLSLSERLGKISGNLLLKVLETIPFPATVQDESKATFTKILTKDDGRIDWAKPAAEIYNQWRAYFMWPGVWTTWQGKLLKVIAMEVNTLQMTTEAIIPGTILPNGVVMCGSGTSIKIKTLQLEGKKETTIDSFLNEYKEFIGSFLA
jgi:methionyl-tRNA formyltransferase